MLAVCLRLLLWLLPLWLLWRMLASTVLVPLLLSINSIWWQPLFTDIHPVLEQRDDGWVVKTQLFRANKDYLHNSYQPNLKVGGFTEQSLGHLIGGTLGLPLFWLLLLATRCFRWQVALVGSAWIVLALMISVGLVLYVKTSQVLLLDETLRVLADNRVMVPEIPAQWWVTAMKACLDAVTFFSFLLLPVWLMYRALMSSVLATGNSALEVDSPETAIPKSATKAVPVDEPDKSESTAIR